MNTSSKTSCLPALFTALLLCLLPATAMADTANALKFYEQAKQAYGAGNYRDAADLLERAYAEDPDLIYQYNRIRALEANRDYEQALKVLNIYKGPMMRDKDKRFEDVEQIEQEVLGFHRVLVPGSRDGRGARRRGAWSRGRMRS